MFCPAGKRVGVCGERSQERGKGIIASAWRGFVRVVSTGRCTTAKLGRKIVRLAHEEDKQRFEAQYEACKEIYDRRKSRAEHPFGYIKRNC